DELPRPAAPPGLHCTIEGLRADSGAGAATPAARVHPTRKHHRRRCRKVTRRTPSGRRKTVFVCPRKHRRRRPARHARLAQAPGPTAFLTNPPTCVGLWRVRIQLTYNGGTE